MNTRAIAHPDPELGARRWTDAAAIVLLCAFSLFLYRQIALTNLVLPAEFAKAQEAGVETAYAELDKDGDGKLSKEEYAVVLGEDCE